MIDEEFKVAMKTKPIVEVPVESTDRNFALLAPRVNTSTRDAMLEMWR